MFNYSNKISKGTFGLPGFSVDGGLKGLFIAFLRVSRWRSSTETETESLIDAWLMQSLAEGLDHPVPLPTLERAIENLKRAKESYGADYDWSVLATGARIDAGLDPFKPGTENGKKLP